METYVYVCVYIYIHMCVCVCIYILMLQKCSLRVRVYKTRAYLLRFFSPHTKPNTVAVPSSILANLRNNFNYSLKRKSEHFGIMIKKDNQVQVLPEIIKSCLNRVPFGQLFYEII